MNQKQTQVKTPVRTEVRTNAKGEQHLHVNTEEYSSIVLKPSIVEKLANVMRNENTAFVNEALDIMNEIYWQARGIEETIGQQIQGIEEFAKSHPELEIAQTNLQMAKLAYPDV